MTLEARDDSGENSVLVINDRQISNYSEYAPVVSIIKHAHTRVSNEWYELELSILPESDDSAVLSGCNPYIDPKMSAIYTTISTLEKIVFTEGCLLSATLDWWDEKVFTFKFNKSVKIPGASI